MSVTHGSVDECEGGLGNGHVGRPQFVVDDGLLVDLAFLQRVQHNDVAHHRRLHTRHTTQRISYSKQRYDTIPDAILTRARKQLHLTHGIKN